MSEKKSVYAVLLATLLALGAKIGKSLSFAWIFQHAKIGNVDTDKADELQAALDKSASVYLRTIYGTKDADMSIANVLTTKQLFMFATIARGNLKASDFTHDTEAQKLINALARAADASFNFKAMQAPTPKVKTNVKTSKRVIELRK